MRITESLGDNTSLVPFLRYKDQPLTGADEVWNSHAAAIYSDLFETILNCCVDNAFIRGGDNRATKSISQFASQQIRFNPAPDCIVNKNHVSNHICIAK